MFSGKPCGYRRRRRQQGKAKEVYAQSTLDLRRILQDNRIHSMIRPIKEDSTLYTEQDLNNIKAQQKKRWLVLGIPGALLLIGLIISLVVRI